MLDQANHLPEVVTRQRLRVDGASPQNVVKRVRILGRSRGLSSKQLEAELNSDAAGDFVLQGEQNADVALKPVRPQMRVRFGIGELGVDANLFARPLNAPFEHIAHADLAADLFRIDRLVPISERGVARDDERADEPRQIGRQVFSDPVGKILLVGSVAEIGEG